MNNLTKMKIHKSAHDIFEAFVHPDQIGNFWFSSSSSRWERGAFVTLRYEEYNAEVHIQIVDIEVDHKIIFNWGAEEEKHTVTITLHEDSHGATLVEVIEEGFQPEDKLLIEHLIDNKEGWVYMLTCLKGYLEYGVDLRAALVK